MRSRSPGLVVVFLTALSSGSTAHAETPNAGSGDDPLRRNYVDLGIQGGASWLGNVGDGRWSPIGPGFGTRLSVGRAPYWGCIYVDVAFFSARDGVVDPVNNERPDLVTTSAGWCGKMAIRLTPHLYLFPMVGGGFGVLDYASGSRGRHTAQDLNEARVMGLGLQAEATLVYKWRFGALTLQPIRATAFLFEGLSEHNYVSASGSGSAFGLNRHGLSLGASMGLSLDLSAMALAIVDSVRGVAERVRASVALRDDG